MRSRAIVAAGVIVALGILAAGARGVPPLRSAFPRISSKAAVVDWQALAVKRLAGWQHAERQRNAARAQVRNLRMTLLRRPDVEEAIELAAIVYGQSPVMLKRKASCESTGGHGYNPRAHNPSGAAGLFEFLGSTWRSTPFARFSPYSFFASALAAGWMHRQGRGGEWVCQ